MSDRRPGSSVPVRVAGPWFPSRAEMSTIEIANRTRSSSGSTSLDNSSTDRRPVRRPRFPGELVRSRRVQRERYDIERDACGDDQSGICPSESQLTRNQNTRRGDGPTEARTPTAPVQDAVYREPPCPSLPSDGLHRRRSGLSCSYGAPCPWVEIPAGHLVRS